ncbi:MAG: hypothetical protein KAH57_08480, partial [Thermoplasmata archaeon]|nr:hypothetical protein [Thermoplasmata archaeon]
TQYIDKDGEGLENDPSYTSLENHDRSCPRCKGQRGPLSVLCDECGSKIPLDHKIDLDSPFLLACIGLIASFSILLLDDASNLFSGNYQGSVKDLYYVLAIISFSIALSLLLLSRDQLFKKGFYKALVIIISPSLIIYSILLIFIYELSLASVFFSSILALFTIISIYIFRSFLKKIRVKHMILLILGIFSVDLGFALSIFNIVNDHNFWFLSGGVILVVGIGMLLISTVLIGKDLSMVEVESIPNVILFISSILLVIPIYIHGGNLNDPSPLLLSSIILGFTLLIIASGIWIRKKVIDEEIRINTRDISFSIQKCDELIKEGHNYYALQQLDRAIMLNPIDGLGKGKDQDNIILRLKGSYRMDKITFSPDEYELGLNEKGKMLASQGRFQDAVKEFQEAIKRRPDYIDSYMNLSMLLISIPGKRRESCKNIGYLLSYKDHYISSWLEDDLPYRHLRWLSQNYMIYQRSLDRKSEILSEMGAKGDIWSYYSLVKD